jgi:hypothetical protein
MNAMNWNATLATRLFPAALSLALACTWGLRSAHADIYTWVDKDGMVNVSNLTPPDDVKVKKVVKENPRSASSSPSKTTPDVVPRADVEMLSARVRELEQQVALAAQPPPPPVVYPAIPAPPPSIQYMLVSADASVNVAPSPTYGCDPSFSGCGGWWGFGYPAGVVFVGGNQNFRRSFPGHGAHPSPVNRPSPPRGPWSPLRR